MSQSFGQKDLPRSFPRFLLNKNVDMHSSWAAPGSTKIAMAIGIMQVEVQLLSMHQVNVLYDNSLLV